MDQENINDKPVMFFGHLGPLNKKIIFTRVKLASVYWFLSCLDHFMIHHSQFIGSIVVNCFVKIVVTLDLLK